MVIRRPTGNAAGYKRSLFLILVFPSLLCWSGQRAWGYCTTGPLVDPSCQPSGILILDGSYVLNVGEAHVNITNFGLIGSTPGSGDPLSFSPSFQWPAGSEDEYLYYASFWIGGVVLGERLVTTGIHPTPAGNNNEVSPLPNDLDATIYEAIGAKVTRPVGYAAASGRREPMPDPDDDGDGLVDEEILNGADDDEDGLLEEDFGQIGNQMFVCTMYDNTKLVQERNPDHTPMNLEIVQKAFQWENDQADDFVGFEFTVKNVGVLDIQNVYLGFFADSDVHPRSLPDGYEDDLAGYFDGMVATTDGSYVPVSVGYMFDAAEGERLDGYFGVMFLGHDIDPTGETAPQKVKLRTFQRFSGNQSFLNGGDPSNDNERYELLSMDEFDPPVQAGKEDDYRFLVSAGPFLKLGAGASLRYEVAMVVGPGLGSDGATRGLLPNCAEAALTYHGIFVDEVPAATPLDPDHCPDFNPGQLGRETMLCREDYEGAPGTVNRWDTFFPDFGDTSCVDKNWLLSNAARLTDCDKFLYTFPGGKTKTCAMFNLDNCFECARQVGHYCTAAGREIQDGQWNCNRPGEEAYPGCTGMEGKEHQIHWLVGMAPPPPGLRLWPADSRVHVFWDDRSENELDIRLNQIDFESYRIWRADNWDRPFGSSLENGPESGLWHLIAEYDLINDFVDLRVVGTTVVLDTIPLGANTGLEIIRYTPVCLGQSRFAGLAEAMQEVVDGDPLGRLQNRPELRLTDGSVDPRCLPLIPWETYPDVLDTFFAVAYRAADDSDPENPVLEKRSTRYYEYIDRDVHNGFLYFYSVTATDHALLPADNAYGLAQDIAVGPGLAGDPGSAFQNTIPGTKAQTAEERERFGVNIYVYPNPATREALAEFQQMQPTGDDPTGVRVEFTNLPASRNQIQIFTLAGDLVQTIEHDGSGGVGRTSWNLMSRNDQEIVSGVYLYVVHAQDDRFEDYIGKFVVVR